MKSLKWSLRIGGLGALGVFLTVVTVVAVSAGPSASTGPKPPPASAPVPVVSTAPSRPAATAPANGVRELLGAVVERAQTGRFDQALKLIGKAPDSVTKDQRVSAARKHLEEYLNAWREAEAGRARDYRQAVRRVGWYMIAQAHVAKLAENGAAQPSTQPSTQPATGPARTLRGGVEAVLSATNKAGGSKSLEQADEKKAGKLRSEAVKALSEASDRLDETLDLLRADDGQYARTFRTIGKSLRERMSAYRKAWEAVRTVTVEQRKAGVRKLLELEERLAESLVNLRAMVDEAPWRLALSQARLARLLAADREKLATEEWFKKFLADIEARGRDAIGRAGKGKNGGKDGWYDALRAYAALESLAPQNEEHRRMLKVVRRHVRVLGIYGGEPATVPATRPAGDDDGSRWEKLVEDVDADMIRKVIPWLGRAYVSAIDFRKLVRGGLRSVRILAESPQVAGTFRGLADKDKRDAFLKAIGDELKTVEARDRVNEDTLQLALNEVLEASERTVGIPANVLIMEFTDGFLDELDQFSSMIWPYNVKKFNKNIKGKFIGVGIHITKVPKEPLRVVSPLADSPAYKAEIKKDDLITAVDGTLTKDKPIDMLVDMIMGKRGTTVVLTIKREGRLNPFDVKIIRDIIKIPTIKGWHREPGTGKWSFRLDSDKSIGYVRLEQFTDASMKDLAGVLNRLRNARVNSLVLDLRFNPGGRLHVPIRVVDEFVGAGRIVSTKGRQGSSAWAAKPRGRYLDGDMVVLINGQSASAAEIVSGALKDLKRAVVVGQRSYGKGSVQTVIKIPRHKAELKLTTAYYYLPNGRLIHKRNGQKEWGVDPDVPVFLTPRRMRRWLTMQRDTDLVQDIGEADLAGDLAEQYKADIQLRAAVLILKLKRLRRGKPAA